MPEPSDLSMSFYNFIQDINSVLEVNFFSASIVIFISHHCDDYVRRIKPNYKDSNSRLDDRERCVKEPRLNSHYFRIVVSFK